MTASMYFAQLVIATLVRVKVFRGIFVVLEAGLDTGFSLAWRMALVLSLLMVIQLGVVEVVVEEVEILQLVLLH